MPELKIKSNSGFVSYSVRVPGTAQRGSAWDPNGEDEIIQDGDESLLKGYTLSGGADRFQVPTAEIVHATVSGNGDVLIDGTPINLSKYDPRKTLHVRNNSDTEGGYFVRVSGGFWETANEPDDIGSSPQGTNVHHSVDGNVSPSDVDLFTFAGEVTEWQADPGIELWVDGAQLARPGETIDKTQQDQGGDSGGDSGGSDDDSGGSGDSQSNVVAKARQFIRDKPAAAAAGVLGAAYVYQNEK